MSQQSSTGSGDKYKTAGVDIEAGNALVEKIKPAAQASKRPGVMGGLGGFGGVFDLKACGYEDPLLVSGTDGVGTKLLLAQETGLHTGLGQDLVAMCVNDIVVQGAEPLFFLDYAATGALDVDQMADIIGGIAHACEACGCALIGGETAEMPGLYAPGHYDLAGFAVGAVERSQILVPGSVKTGDVILGLASGGVHANGFSLVRKILSDQYVNLGDMVPGTTTSWGEALMAPTILYVKACLDLNRAGYITGFAHVTGGGLLENIPRVLTSGQCADISVSDLELPPLFKALSSLGDLSARDLVRTFNCGIGMAVFCRADQADMVTARAESLGHAVTRLGTVTDRDDGVRCQIDDPGGRWAMTGQWPVTLADQ